MSAPDDITFNGRPLIPNTLYAPRPAFRPAYLDHPTLLVSWWCCAFAAVIIVTRLAGRFNRMMKVYTDDWWMVASIIPLSLRMGFAHMVLRLGTNNMDMSDFASFTREGGYTGVQGLMTWSFEEEVARRERGSRFLMGARIAYAAFLWHQRFCITEFHRKLTLSYWNTRYSTGLTMLRWSLAASLLAVVVSATAECTPATKYWQVIPDPGPKCRQGVAPLIATTALSAATDLIIVLFPLPVILRSRMNLTRKVFLILSLSLSFIPAAMSIYKVFWVLRFNSAQPQRTLWASFEILAHCAVANAIVINSFVRDKGPKKNKYRGPGGRDMVYSPEQMKRGPTREGLDGSVRKGLKVWGSDEDLVKGMGVGMRGDLRRMSDPKTWSGRFDFLDDDDDYRPPVTPHHNLNNNYNNSTAQSVDHSNTASSYTIVPTSMNEGQHGAPSPPPAGWPGSWANELEAWQQTHPGVAGMDLVLPPPPAEVPAPPPKAKTSPPKLDKWGISLDNGCSTRDLSHATRDYTGDAIPLQDMSWSSGGQGALDLFDVGGLLESGPSEPVMGGRGRRKEADSDSTAELTKGSTSDTMSTG